MKSAYQVHCRDKKEAHLTKQYKRKEKTVESAHQKLELKKFYEGRNKKAELSINQFLNEEMDIDIIEKTSKSPNQFINVKINDKIKVSFINTNNFSLLAQTVLRYGTSNREAAANSSAVLEELNKLIIDNHKIHREKKIVMEKFQKDDLLMYQSEDIKALSFDGKKNLTLINEQDETTLKYSKTIKMVFYTVTSEPLEKYVFHFSPLEPSLEEKPALMIAKPIAD
ncbi:uncharacterized protein LOC136082358 [Hydra vulgaris]|uniref:Uncharacterized protein LOC136082358 n=1 Tax=Hydra vulgaris TaxID=6087 RepID=A0ABM4C7B1_HYDVU